jgi:hypothetical protein
MCKAVLAATLLLTATGANAMPGCKYAGKLTRPCRAALRQTAKELRRQPDATVVMVGGDDSTGEYLVSRGIDPGRISEIPATDGRLNFVILIEPVRAK